MSGVKANKKLTSDTEILQHHLPYEYNMLSGTYMALISKPHSAVVHNALIESFCIHARQLIEFFGNKQGVKAEEFTGGSYKAKHIGGLAAEVEKLNQQIAHITRKRTDDPLNKIGDADRRRMIEAITKECIYFATQLVGPFKTLYHPPNPMQVRVGAAPGASSEIVVISDHGSLRSLGPIPDSSD